MHIAAEQIFEAQSTARRIDMPPQGLRSELYRRQTAQMLKGLCREAFRRLAYFRLTRKPPGSIRLRTASR